MATRDLEPFEIPPGKYYTKAQVARLKGVDRTTVNHWIQKGWLPAIRIGNLYLISAQALEEFIPQNFGPRFVWRG